MSELSKLSPSFRDFLIEAKQHGYGSPDAQQTRTETGSQRIVYQKGPYIYLDSFVGGEPFGGYEHVSVKLGYTYTPIWAMAYYETHKDPELADEELGKVLSTVLAQPDPSLPIRGPNHWKQGKYEYALYTEDYGALEKFTAEEWIAKQVSARQKKVIYTARFIGGLVNLDASSQVIKPNWLEGELTNGG